MGEPQPVAPTFPLPIRRELLGVDAWLEDGHVVIQLMCDCAAVTAVRLVDEPPDGELAISCASCHTSHWITVSGSAP